MAEEDRWIFGLLIFVVVIGGWAFVQLRGRFGGGGGGRGGSSDESAMRIGGPEAQAMAADIRRGVFASVLAMLNATRQSGAWDDRGFFLSTLRDAIGTIPRMTFDAWAQNEPQNPAMWLLRGVHGIEWAWQARGSGVASTVSNQMAMDFEQRLRVAESDLQRAAQLDPADPTPWAFMLICAKGLSHDRPIAHSYFANAMQRDPENALACEHMLGYLHPKWGGTAEEITAFARTIAQRARPGSDLAAFLIVGHVHVYEYTALFQEQPAVAHAALSGPQFRGECEMAYANSLGAPNHVPRRSTIVLRNYVAFWLYKVSDTARLRNEIMRIGNAHSNAPWHYDGESCWLIARQFAGL